MEELYRSSRRVLLLLQALTSTYNAFFMNSLHPPCSCVSSHAFYHSNVMKTIYVIKQLSRASQLFGLLPLIFQMGACLPPSPCYPTDFPSDYSFSDYFDVQELSILSVVNCHLGINTSVKSGLQNKHTRKIKQKEQVTVMFFLGI